MNILLGAALLYGAVVGGLYFLQGNLIFRRDIAARGSYPLPPGNERLELRTATGERLVGNLVRATGKSRGLVLGFSGNAWNADDCTTFMAHRLKDVDIAVFHYRGYTPSEGKPSEAALFEDALQIHDTLVKGLAPTRTYAFGFSLGSGVAAYLAASRPVAGQLLVTPFDSIEAVAASRYKAVPVRYLIKHRFRSTEHLAGRAIPTAVILASDDRIVPRERSERLLAALTDPVMVETVPDSTHGGIYDMEAIDGLLRTALDRLEARAIQLEEANTRQPAAAARG